jgi:energy-coupling factor transporter transmembrane protein EcfT
VVVDPRLRALYLAAVAVGIFFLPGWELCAAVAGAQLVLWLGLGLGARGLFRQLRKLTLLLGLIWAAYAFLGEDPARDRWVTLEVFGLELELNRTGALDGLAMILRIVAVVLASHVARAGDPRALAAGLRRLGLPRPAAVAIDTVLALLGDGGGGGERQREAHGANGSVASSRR